MEKITDYFNKPDGFPVINYGDEILLLGSCFSNSIGDKLNYFGFNSTINPLGVVFHPLALAKQMERALNNDFTGKIFANDDIHLHSLASSEIYGLSLDALKENYRRQLTVLKQSLVSSRVLFITFGSMHGYWLNETNEIVSNCHKQHPSNFTKRVSEIDEIVNVWNQLIADFKTINPKLQVVFTVSPVRYTRDGILENTLSKSRLIEVCNQLNQLYFPSFELINDVLRDFSFFESDQSHPNQKAIEEVWKLFADWMFNSETEMIYQKVKELRIRESHRLLFPDSKQSLEFQRITKEKREQICSLSPSILL